MGGYELKQAKIDVKMPFAILITFCLCGAILMAHE
jgi:hypothetical protein